MSETNSDAAKPAIDSTAKKPAAAEKKDEGFFSFLFWLVLAVVVLRSFIISPFNIPSESMLPRLLTGDYLFATKWSYGYSRYSLPFSLPLIPGRIFASQPERGDVVIFKAPPGNDVDYIKRVIGLPGDEIQIKSGQVFINGKAVPKQRVDDFILPVSPNTDCYGPEFEATGKDGKPVCHYPQFRETLPNGKSYNVLDLGTTPQDDTGVYIVPEDHLFLMGDNRDNSMDSRFPAVEGQGIGIVPQGNLVGKAAVMMFSTDGSAEWIKPWTWFTAARWSRIGGTF
ncbi:MULTISPECIES: signal peptidase I [unclassified Novosphingobium]|uniref:signal peptidase I n=1 Tax=unclassified Novosphingobium TaxID=2644732 RepID=UPI00020EEF47|nr:MULTISPECIES: signal peptidase I [unclassified Novosphingobium]BBA73967.1 signal peptidase I [Novosphingobium sp. PY1]GFM31204.1 signal peptidase I [Novosphingobium sp. PY1]CCA93744.1 signal peptidase I [Novosphingobium sp. PP1Y]